MRWLRRIRRWWVIRFRTTVRPAQYNRHRGRMLTSEEWDAAGGWQGALVWGFEASRPDWWGRGSRSAIVDATPEEAERRLTEWQDDMARRAT